MAEGFARIIGKEEWDVCSAGTQMAEEVNPNAVKVMAEKRIDISMQRPKTLQDIPGKWMI